MKKVISIVLALALMLSLSIAATPVLADVTPATVDVNPPTVNTFANYTITFNITASLGAGVGTVSVQFPANTVVPTTYAGGAVTVQTKGIGPGDISGSGRVVTIYLPDPISVPQEGSIEVTVVFKTEAGIKNPPTANEYSLDVRTSRETTWIPSRKYGLSLPDKSTYEFLYSQPPLISLNVPAEVQVTLKAKVLGSAGYDEARIVVAKAGGPDGGDVAFQVYYLGAWSESDTYPPTGNFTVQPNHNQVIPFRFTFSKVGLYTLNFTLMRGATVIDHQGAETFACAGVSVNVPLNKGWNLMSLPIIPHNSTIATLLAGIIEDVTSVWYYDPTSKQWQSYAPPTTPTLTKIEDGKAYWIDMKNTRTLTVEGVAIVLPGQLPPAYSVREGWNMVGFKSVETDMTAGSYLNGTYSVRIYEFWAGSWTSLATNSTMTPGRGYWVSFSKAGTIYP